VKTTCPKQKRADVHLNRKKNGKNARPKQKRADVHLNRYAQT
jgi:hypothetical protein